MTKEPFKNSVISFFKSIQDDICNQLSNADGKAKFEEDIWERPEGGGGRTRVIQDGNILEKGGVNFSAVQGNLPENIKNALGLKSTYFFATGVSIVIHPINPNVPIIHMNIRYFETKSSEFSDEIENSWFGGGIDLTPHYVDKLDASWFHQQLKNSCDLFDLNYYPEFKKWADDYFFIKHRNETRGIGGIFFDRLQQNEIFSIQDRFEFVKKIGQTFAPTYTTLMLKNNLIPFSDQQILWRNIRRGRYVEFNLVYDKGTKFGLETNGRIESILMSLPKTASWPYDFKPEKESQEELTLSLLIKGIDWINA